MRNSARPSRVYVGESPPKPLNLVEPIARLQTGAQETIELARRERTTARRLDALAFSADPLQALVGPVPEFTRDLDLRARRILGQLIIGNLAERVFEDLYATSVGTQDLRLEDDRVARGDTDYLVLDGIGRRVFRINIKFNGSQFRSARQLVGLDPDDCFALATYKIHAALQKQDAERLPYIFVIVGVPGLTGDQVGDSLPDELVRLAAFAHEVPRITGKRQIEDRIVDRLTSEPDAFGVGRAIGEHISRIRGAPWYVLSARRADRLLREMLFERAYALRVRSFARNYRGAELDMHFSLTQDLRPLGEFLEVLREHGMPGLVSRLERGTL